MLKVFLTICMKTLSSSSDDSKLLSIMFYICVSVYYTTPILDYHYYRTLDTMDTFSVSVNPYDHILSLQPSNYGIWISLRGSSILELWDPRTLNCRMLYDTRTDRYPQLRKVIFWVTFLFVVDNIITAIYTMFS